MTVKGYNVKMVDIFIQKHVYFPHVGGIYLLAYGLDCI